MKGDRSLWTQCQAVDEAYTCGHMPKIWYPSLRVAYIDKVKEPRKDAKQNLDQVGDFGLLFICVPKLLLVTVDVISLVGYLKIKLPRPAILGEGKPENQNHAIIFTRGKGLQTIDMNQHDDVRYPTILSIREHIFTG
ncbi:callose synthase 3-like protein, partial [Tanacetum coccineum]